jgi:aminoglycoside/choline kinase family phosphotransferase
MKLVGYFARLVEARNKCGVLDGIIKGKRHLEHVDVETDVLTELKEVRC